MTIHPTLKSKSHFSITLNKLICIRLIDLILRYLSATDFGETMKTTMIAVLGLMISTANAGFLEAPYPKITNSQKRSVKFPLSKLEDFAESFQVNIQATLDKKLNIKLDEKNNDFNAYATIDDNDDALIIVNQGLVNHEEMTTAMLDLFMCHELGHLLGGDPKVVLRNGKKSWSSVEGQADYFATAECMPKLGHARDEIINASVTLTKLIAKMRGYQQLPSTEQVDRSRPGYLVQTHPAPQCRLDTLLAGLAKLERPRCWYDLPKDQ